MPCEQFDIVHCLNSMVFLFFKFPWDCIIYHWKVFINPIWVFSRSICSFTAYTARSRPSLIVFSLVALAVNLGQYAPLWSGTFM